MRFGLTFFVNLGLFLSSSVFANQQSLQKKYNLEMLDYEISNPFIFDVKLRVGSVLESPKVDFKGCILYLQGLADSSVNHEEFFNNLSANGFRVIFFDYMGQGGSTGSMNNSLVASVINQDLEVGEQGKFVWDYFSKKPDSVNARDCSKSKKNIIGWSTGGLAALKLAHENWPNSVVLISPAFTTRPAVGEASEDPLKLLMSQPVITERTMTSDVYTVTNKNPHVEPLKPNHPLKVPSFSANLVTSALLSIFWDVEQSVNGLMFVGGKDSYVHAEKNIAILKNIAPHFKSVYYPNAFHEIHNEVKTTRDDLTKRTIQFFKAHN